MQGEREYIRVSALQGCGREGCVGEQVMVVVVMIVVVVGDTI